MLDQKSRNAEVRDGNDVRGVAALCPLASDVTMRGLQRRRDDNGLLPTASREEDENCAATRPAHELLSQRPRQLRLRQVSNSWKRGSLLILS